MISMKEVFEEYLEMSNKILHLELENWQLKDKTKELEEELKKCRTSDSAENSERIVNGYICTRYKI